MDSERRDSLRVMLKWATNRRDYWADVLRGKAAVLLMEGPEAGARLKESQEYVSKLEALLKEDDDGGA